MVVDVFFGRLACTFDIGRSSAEQKRKTMLAAIDKPLVQICGMKFCICKQLALNKKS